MKIRNLTRRVAQKIGAILIAMGVCISTNVYAADLDTNLVVNPSFENVDTGTGGSFGSVLILDWDGNGFAYNYSQSYDNGGPLAGGGDYYFNGGSGDGGTPISQNVDVSTGDVAAEIAAGNAKYDLSAYFSSYLAQGDFGNVSAMFLDSGNSVLATETVSDADTSTWTMASSSGVVPIGTTMVRIESQGTAVVGSADGYADLVDFRITQVPEPSTGILAGMGLAGVGMMLRRRKREQR